MPQSLTLGQRFRLLARAAVGIFTDDLDRESQRMLVGLFPGTLGSHPEMGTRDRVDAYNTHPWARSAVGLIANSSASAEWRLYVARKNGVAVRDCQIQRAHKRVRKDLVRTGLDIGQLQRVTEHLFLDILHTGNAFQTGFEMQKVMQCHLELAGDCFLLKQRNSFGKPIALWPIPPHWVLNTPTLTRPMFRVGYRGWQREIPETEIFWHSDPNPSNPYGRGSGAIGALADELDTDEAAAKTTKAWFSNSAKPDLLVTGSGMRESETQRLEQDWNAKNQGFWRRWRAHFINRDVKVHEFSQDFRCHDAETECLTRRGWRKHDQLCETDELATWNELRQQIEWQRPQAIHKYEFTGTLHRWKNSHVDALVTRNHRLWFQPISQQSSCPWRFDESRDVLAKSYAGDRPGGRRRSFNGRWGMRWRMCGHDTTSLRTMIDLPEGVYSGAGRRSNQISSPIPVEIFAPFLGYFLSEGSYSSKGYSVCISQTTATGELTGIAKDIWEATQAIGDAHLLTNSRKTTTGRTEWTIRLSGQNLSEWLKKNAGETCVTRRIPDEVFEWPERNRLQLLFAMIDGDGRWHKASPERAWSADYGTSSQQFADDIQRLCTGLGIRTKLWKTKIGAFCVSMTTRETAEVYERNMTEELYSGIVWCATVPNGTLFTRRNGCVMVSGNSQQFVAIRTHERDIVLQSLGIPPELIGAIENSNRATISVSEYLFSRFVLTPRLESLREAFQEKFLPEYDERLILDYESPVDEDREHALESAKIAPWSLNADEWRQLQGHPPVENGGGKVYMVPNTLVPTKDLSKLPVPAASDGSAKPSGGPKPGDSVPSVPSTLGQRALRNGAKHRNGSAPHAEDDEPADPIFSAQKAWRRDLQRTIPIFRDAGDLEAENQVLKALSDDPEDLPPLVRLATRLEPEMRRRFLAAVERVRGQIDEQDLEAAIRTGRISPVEAALNLEAIAAAMDAGLTPPLKQSFMTGATYGQEALSEAGISLRFDLVNPRAVEWVRLHGAELVTGITEESRLAMREAIRRAFSEGRTPAQTARDLRGMVGLTERQADAVDNFRARLLEDGVSSDVVERRAGKYADAQLRLRAQTIARTEILTASNAGQQAMWLEARHQGLLPGGDGVKRRWLVTNDDRLEKHCEALDGKEVGLNEDFAPGIKNPPLHVNCRCTTALVFT